MRASHGDHQGPGSWNGQEIPRAIESGFFGGPRSRSTIRLIAVAAYSRYTLGFQINGPDGMIFGIGDIELAFEKAHALGAVEGGLLIRAIVERRIPTANRVDEFTVQVSHDDAIVAGVRDKEAFTFTVRQDLSRVEQGALVRL